MRMPRQTLIYAVIVCAGLTPLGTTARDQREVLHSMVVHEWGTFTSVAASDGRPLWWRPLNEPSDLPDFVYSLGAVHRKSARNRQVKSVLRAKVRMETPVIYFYSDRPATVSVSVSFPEGNVTEWYPQALLANSAIQWNGLRLVPSAEPEFPKDVPASHYYHARATDSVPIEINTADELQREKFLFYRGVGNFDQPITAKLERDQIVARSLDGGNVGPVIVFENRSGRIGFHVGGSLESEVRLHRPAVTDDSRDGLRAELKRLLTAGGLYDKEAEAMIETWDESWFEEGLRVFYILPREIVDRILPIDIDPQPADLVRVLVGRIEIVTPEARAEVLSAVDSLIRGGRNRRLAIRIIEKRRRFLEPILLTAGPQTPTVAPYARVEEVMAILEEILRPPDGGIVR